jgi:hypothetical protein
VKIRRNCKLEKIEKVDLIELEHGDNFVIVFPYAPGYTSIRLQIDNGKLIIKGEFILTQR